MHAAILRYLEAVVQDGSIRRAAERLNVSASAINRQILKLEQRFGTPLFDRRPTGLVLTEAGHIVLAHAHQTLLDYQRVAGEVASLKGRVSGTVTLATLDSLTVEFLPNLLTEFCREAPDVTFRIVATNPVDVTHQVAQGHADLGLTFSPTVATGVSITTEIKTPLKVLMHSHHPLAGRDVIALPDCSEYPLIYPDNSGSMQPFLGSEMSAFIRDHTPRIVSNTLTLTRRLVRNGVGIAFYTELGFRDDLECGAMVAVRLDLRRLADLRLCMILPAERSPTVATSAFADLLQKRLPNLIAGAPVREE